MHVVGARPNFMKVAPVLHALSQYDTVRQIIVHTGQHYDVNMSDIFFQQLGIPAPDVNLEIGSASHAQQTAQIMARFEPVVLEQKPDMVLVYGDVNSTVAATLVCAKLLIPVAHVEAGLRSGDRTMPEEINRLVTDQLADLLFTPSGDGDQNLLREGIAAEKIHCVGNVMIDTLVRLQPAVADSAVLDELHLVPGGYAVLTLHRPSNVDDDRVLGALLGAILALAERLPIVFPVHPRTRHRLERLGLGLPPEGLRLIDPLGYLDFQRLTSQARIVLTDSGGIQEETSYLGIPCLTLRTNTERPVTVAMGTNMLVGNDLDRLRTRFHAILDGDDSWDQRPPGGIPLWDGHAAERIANILCKTKFVGT
nr:UDP-N-acetylglucosamine 2-epimerase (non-hydrolyzing) [Candidatus Chloroploca mongolica]